MDQVAPTKKTSHDDILSAIKKMAGDFDGKFTKIDEKINQTDQRFDNIELRLNRIESTMATKDSVETKIHDLKVWAVESLKNQNKQLVSSFLLLQKKEVFTTGETASLINMEIFPQAN